MNPRRSITPELIIDRHLDTNDDKQPGDTAHCARASKRESEVRGSNMSGPDFSSSKHNTRML